MCCPGPATVLLQAVAARTCRPHYSSSGTSSGSGSTAGSSSSGASSLSGAGDGTGLVTYPAADSTTSLEASATAAAAAAGSAGADSSSDGGLQQLGTCRALLIDSSDSEFELDPFPAACPVPGSPSSHHHGSTAPGGYKAYAGLEMLQVSLGYIADRCVSWCVASNCGW